MNTKYHIGRTSKYVKSISHNNVQVILKLPNTGENRCKISPGLSYVIVGGGGGTWTEKGEVRRRMSYRSVASLPPSPPPCRDLPQTCNVQRSSEAPCCKHNHMLLNTRICEWTTWANSPRSTFTLKPYRVKIILYCKMTFVDIIYRHVIPTFHRSYIVKHVTF